MGRLHRKRPKKPKRCVGCGHAYHEFYCLRGGAWRGCTCRYQPLTKRRRKKLMAKYRSFRRLGWAAPEKTVIGNKKAQHLQELYERFLDIAEEDLT